MLNASFPFHSAWLEAVESVQLGRLAVSGGYLGRENEPDHVQGLLRCRAAAPDRVDRRGLVRDVGPVVARQLAKFREPIREGLRLGANDVLLKCSCHVVKRAVDDLTIAAYNDIKTIRMRYGVSIELLSIGDFA
jgi:hypothetical protein